MGALFLPIALGALASPGYAQSLEVIGYAGYLGEWELTATVTKRIQAGQGNTLAPLMMKHVGLCTQDGPEEKTGEMHFEISASSSRLDATLSVAGVECTYSGQVVRLLYRHDGLPRSRSSTAQAVGQIDVSRICCGKAK